MTDPKNTDVEQNELQAEDSTPCEEETMNRFVQTIDLDNFNDFFARAKRNRADGKLDEAILMLKALIEKGSQLFSSELSLSLADIYFEIGDVWLEKLEKEGEALSSKEGGLINFNREETTAVMDDIIEQMVEEHSDNENHEDSEGGEDEKGEELEVEEKPCQVDDHIESEGQVAEEPMEEHKSQHSDEVEEDLEDIQVAWENIETARHILTKHLEVNSKLPIDEYASIQRGLARCYLRLGNIENVKEDFTNALSEYNKCLETLLKVEDPKTSRLIAEVCFLMGNTYLYEFETEALEKSIYMYEKARDILKANIADRKGLEDMESKAIVGDLEDICNDLEDKIDELKDEVTTNKEDNIDKAKIKEIVGSINNFPKSAFGKDELAKNLGQFGYKKMVPPMEDLKPDVKKVMASDSGDKTSQSE